MDKTARPIEIAKDIYLVGASELYNNLQCNSYLVVDKNSAVLIDPGSVLDFKYVYKNIEQIIDPHLITHFILHHQDPDLCSAVPLFESAIGTREVVTHWRTQVIAQYYDIKSTYYLVDQKGYSLELASGRILSFIMTPYLHFPGAMITYDANTQILFSSDIFGAFFINESLHQVYAGDNYIEAMKAFHEHYMPGNEYLRPIMDVLLNLHISIIAPQHGSIIKREIREHIHVLRDLECGAFLNPIKKELAEAGGYMTICNEILRRCHAIAGTDETGDLFRDTDIVLDKKNGYIVDFTSSGVQLWHNLFRIIEHKKGAGWLSALEVITRKLSTEYDVPMPDVYSSVVADISRQAEMSDQKYREAQDLSDRLLKNVEETREQLLLDPISGLYNAKFFMQYLYNDMSKKQVGTSALLLVALDNLQKINYRYGTMQGDETVKTTAVLIRERVTETMVLGRLEGAVFAVYMPGVAPEAAEEWAERLRADIARATVFIESCTISGGLVHCSEVPDYETDVRDRIEYLHKTAGNRIRIARKRGEDYVCAHSISDQEEDVSTGRILIVDSEKVNVDVLSTVLFQMGFRVAHASDGESALETALQFQPDIIIAEAMLPKIDGFCVREQLMLSSSMKVKPFILMSHVKDETTVARAHALDIVHFFKKPYLLSEMVGVVKKMVRGSVEV